MRQMARDICSSLRDEPWRWRLAYCTLDRDDGISVWRANIPIFDMNLYRPTEASLGFAGRLAVRHAYLRWLREMPLTGYRKPRDSGSGPSGRRREPAPGEAPQSGLSDSEGIAQTLAQPKEQP